MLVLVIGGSGSGKSEFAESRAMEFGGTRIYIAAMKPYGKEAQKRIECHRRLREGKGFDTVERYTDIKNLSIRGTALLECMSNLLANELFEGAGENAVHEILKGIDALAESCDNLVIVTNDVSSDGIEYDSETVGYMRALGTLNCILAEKVDEVYEVIYGAANKIK